MSEFVVTENRVCCGPKSVELFRFAFCVCSFCTLLVWVWSYSTLRMPGIYSSDKKSLCQVSILQQVVKNISIKM